jgi:hypothetical protein
MYRFSFFVVNIMFASLAVGLRHLLPTEQRRQQIRIAEQG